LKLRAYFRGIRPGLIEALPIAISRPREL